MSSYTATYSPDDNKIRLYASTRLDPETYARVKAAGFAWAPKQDLFVAPMWTPGREDLALELAGEIDDEDTSLVDRAEERADRFGDYADSRRADAEQARKAVAAIADNIPFGQPILVGHHSERHARKDAERITNGMRRAVKMWETSGYWKSRAAGAIRAAKYKERPDVRARRIKGLEADQRKQTKEQDEADRFLKVWHHVGTMSGDPDQMRKASLAVANYSHVSRCFPLADYPRDPPISQYQGQMGLWSALDHGIITPAQAAEIAMPAMERTIARCGRWLAHIANRLEYERAMMAEQGGMVADGFDIQPGGRVLIGGEWVVVIQINKGVGGKIASLTTTARFGRVRGIEEVKDYREPTEEEAAKVSEVKKLAPMVNFPGEGFVLLTAAEWKRRPTDYKGSKFVAATDTHGAYRYRSSFLPGGGFRLAQVYITDAKRIDPPTVAAVVAAPVRFERENEAPAPRVARIEDPDAADFDAMRATLKEGVKVVAVPQLFPTPAAVAQTMAALADIKPGLRVLEPSAGTGAIIAALPPSIELVAVEINAALAERLEGDRTSAHHAVRRADFLSILTPASFVGSMTKGGDPAPLGTFDRIIMNPPFAHGDDIRHIRHAITFLRPGGRLVAICADGPRQQERLRPIASRWLPLPAGTFADQGTDVRTVMLAIDAPAQKDTV